LSSTTYDDWGNISDVTLASGRHTHYTYDADGRPATTVVKDYPNAGATFCVESDAYDNAGNVLTQTTGNGQLIVKNAYDEMGRLIHSVEDPSGRNRVTDRTLDAIGNVLTKKISDGVSTHPFAARTDYTYNSFDKVIQQTSWLDTVNHVATISHFDQR